MSGSRIALAAWVTLGVLVALVMPLTAIITALCLRMVSTDSVPFLMTVMLGVIAGAAHVVVLAGGRLAHASKAWLYFTVQHAGKLGESEAAHRTARRRVKALDAVFVEYVHRWKRHNARYGYIEAGPFDQAVAELLRRRFPHLSRSKD